MIKKKDIAQKKFKNTKENNKFDGAGLFSTVASETISRALMRLRAVVVAEDAQTALEGTARFSPEPRELLENEKRECFSLTGELSEALSLLRTTKRERMVVKKKRMLYKCY